MLGKIFYHQSIRKIVTAFGSLFSNTTLVRYNKDGTENIRLIVPLMFGQKEKFIEALESDPKQDKNIMMKLPIISFTILGIKYDSTRKLQTNNQNFQKDTDGSLITQYNPVPWDINFGVSIYTRTIEDGNQILEQIIPFFTPDYTMRVNMIPEMGIIKDIPVLLNSVDPEINSIGPAIDQETRIVIWNLDFTVKGFLFGPTTGSNHIIREAITNIYNWKDLSSRYVRLVLLPGGVGNFKPGEIIYQGKTLSTANATAIVSGWSNNTNRIEIQDVNGIFKTNQTLRGQDSGASFKIINYEVVPQKLETITITPDPLNANIGDPYTYNIVQTFY